MKYRFLGVSEKDDILEIVKTHKELSPYERELAAIWIYHKVKGFAGRHIANILDINQAKVYRRINESYKLRDEDFRFMAITAVIRDKLLGIKTLM